MWMPGLHSRAESTYAAKEGSELWELSFPSFPGRIIRHRCPRAIGVGESGCGGVTHWFASVG